jgi:hypothetical protein
MKITRGKVKRTLCREHMLSVLGILKITHLCVHIYDLAIWRAEIMSITVQSQPGKIVHEAPTPPIAEQGGVHLSSQATQEGEIRSIVIQGHIRQKTLGDPTSKEKTWTQWFVPAIPGMGQNIKQEDHSSGGTGQKPHLQNNQSQRGWRPSSSDRTEFKSSIVCVKIHTHTHQW